MPENFEIANIWVFWLLPLPLLIYLFLPPLRFKSAALRFPGFDKAQEYTGQKPRVSSFVERKKIYIWAVIVMIWILITTTLSSPHDYIY